MRTLFKSDHSLDSSLFNMSSNIEKQQIKEEITFNEALDKQRKEKKSIFKVMFKRGNNEIPSIYALNGIAVNPRQINMKVVQLKRFLLVMAILALTLCTIYVIRTIQVTEGDNSVKNPEKLIDKNEDNNQMNNYGIQLNDLTESVTEPLTTMTSAIKTMTSRIKTKTQELDYILVTIIVNRATVPNKDYTIIAGKSDPYVDLYLDGIKFGSTNVIKDTNNPQWNHHFGHEIKLSINSTIYFEIYDKDLTKNEYIGGLAVKISKLKTEGLNGKITNENYGKGSLWFTVSWTEVYKSN